MNSSKLPQNLLIESSFRAKDVEAIDQLNKTASLKPQGISKTKMLLVTLSTTVMLAKNKPLSKEYYQWTRAYLETVHNDDGTKLSNIGALLKHIDTFENDNQIQDEMQNSREELPEDELIEGLIEGAQADESMDEDEPLLSSTVNKPVIARNSNENAAEVVAENVVEKAPEAVAANANESEEEEEIILETEP